MGRISENLRARARLQAATILAKLDPRSGAIKSMSPELLRSVAETLRALTDGDEPRYSTRDVHDDSDVLRQIQIGNSKTHEITHSLGRGTYRDEVHFRVLAALRRLENDELIHRRADGWYLRDPERFDWTTREGVAEANLADEPHGDDES